MNITISNINALDLTRESFAAKERMREASEMESRNWRWETVNPGASLTVTSRELRLTSSRLVSRALMPFRELSLRRRLSEITAT